MKSVYNAPARPGDIRPFCTIDLWYEFGARHDGVVHAAVEIPGKDGDFTRDWVAIQGTLSPEQANDLVAWVQTYTSHALLRYLGIQAGLPLA